MKNIWKWILLFLGIFLLVLVIATPLFMRFNLGWLPMMGGLGLPMHRGLGFFGGWIMLLKMVVPLAILGLAIFGVVTLFRKPKDTATTLEACSSCGKPLQVEWSNCPYCGKKKKN